MVSFAEIQDWVFLLFEKLKIIMMNQLQKIVEECAQEQIIQNKAIPDQLNNAAIREVCDQMFTCLKDQVTKGAMQEVVTLFQKNSMVKQNNPLVATMTSCVASSLTSKFSITPQVSQSVANNLVPTVLNQVIARTNDPRNIDFDLQQMMRGMTGNSSLDISQMLNQAPKTTVGSVSGVFGKIFGKQ